MTRGQRILRRLLWTAGVLAGLVVLAWLGMLGLMRSWVAHPPALTSPPPITQLQPETRGDRVQLGRNWLERRDGLPVLHVAGSAFELGYANGVLTQSYIHNQEEVLLQLMGRVAPYSWTQFLLKFFITYRNRHLPDSIPSELQLELLGLSRGCPDLHPEIGPYFHRILNYHAAQDVSYMLMNSPLLRGGCTAFGAWGPDTRNAHLLAGRNFDWEADPVFDRDRLVIFCEPDEGIPFVSLAWSGMAGVVTGLNREGLFISVNGAPSDLPGDAAAPTCIVARDVLQHCRTLAEAIERIRQHRVFVSALFLVGARLDGRFVVVEKTPTLQAVREPGSATRLVCPNHYFTTALTNTAINQRYLQSDTSASRHRRMEETLAAEAGSLDPTAAIAILRDRRLPGNQPAGNGHRASLNPLIATHAAVADLTDGLFWAATSPHQLGRFVAFDVRDPERRLPSRTLAADPILASGEYARYEKARDQLKTGWRRLHEGEPDAALAAAAAAETNNPSFYQIAILRAEAQAALHHWTEAQTACQQALDGQPALGIERARLLSLRQQVDQHLPPNQRVTPP